MPGVPSARAPAGCPRSDTPRTLTRRGRSVVCAGRLPRRCCRCHLVTEPHLLPARPDRHLELVVPGPSGAVPPSPGGLDLIEQPPRAYLPYLELRSVKV